VVETRACPTELPKKTIVDFQRHFRHCARYATTEGAQLAEFFAPLRVRVVIKSGGKVGEANAVDMSKWHEQFSWCITHATWITFDDPRFGPCDLTIEWESNCQGPNTSEQASP
jgi:hypothetical protein